MTIRNIQMLIVNNHFVQRHDQCIILLREGNVFGPL